MQPAIPVRRTVALAATLAVGLLVASPARAQPAGRAKGSKAAPPGVTDVVGVAGGGEIRGAVVTKLPDGSLDVAVQRDWLEANVPEAAAALVAEERRQTRAVMEDLAAKLAATIRDLPESRSRVLALVRREADRVDAWLAAADAEGPADAGAEADAPREKRPAAARRGDSQFALLRIAPKRVAGVRPSGQAAQRVARWAWSERLADVETRSAADLSAELEARGIDPRAPPPGLGERLPPLPQDDREWAARMALVEDALGDPVVFQGMGDTVIRAGEAGGELAGLLPQLGRLMGNGGGEGIGDLLRGLADGPPAGAAPRPAGGAGQAERWLESARRQAGDVGRHRTTRVEVDPHNGRAVVESVFEARMPDGAWETIWRESSSADAATADEATVQRITADERVSGLLQAIRGIGIVDEGAILQAIRVGAVTMRAQQQLDATFQDFRSRHIRRLDVPPLRWDRR